MMATDPLGLDWPGPATHNRATCDCPECFLARNPVLTHTCLPGDVCADMDATGTCAHPQCELILRDDCAACLAAAQEQRTGLTGPQGSVWALARDVAVSAA
jgi:hypothetical protein